MRIALVDSTRKPKVYPISLLKLGAWRKSLGDECKLFSDILPSANEYDEIWITTTFTFDIPHAKALVQEAKKRCKRVFVGGISATLLPHHFESLGVDVHKGLVYDAEQFAPDYLLLDYTPEYSITYTTRGCIRKCKFCMVSKLEPEFSNRDNWVKNIHPKAKEILFYDNNWLAKGIDGVKRDVEIIKRLKAQGMINTADFNQSLDCRLMTKEMADIISGAPIIPMRFAFDGMHEDGHFQNAIRLMAERGYKDFVIDVLYNFNDTPQDFYYRLREHAKLSQELCINCRAFPMRYQPILDIDKGRDFVGKHWTERQKKGFGFLMRHASHTGVIGCSLTSDESPLKQFEYWFGANENEFVKIVSYPKIGELCKRKKGNLRMMRMQ